LVPRFSEAKVLSLFSDSSSLTTGFLQWSRPRAWKQQQQDFIQHDFVLFFKKQHLYSLPTLVMLFVSTHWQEAGVLCGWLFNEHRSSRLVVCC